MPKQPKTAVGRDSKKQLPNEQKATAVDQHKPTAEPEQNCSWGSRKQLRKQQKTTTEKADNNCRNGKKLLPGCKNQPAEGEKNCCWKSIKQLPIQEKTTAETPENFYRKGKKQLPK